MSARPCVGIFDANYASTLAVVRSLARMGAPFKVYHHHKRCVSALSRYVDTVRPSPFLDDYTRFPDWLNNQLDQGAFDLIMPTSDVVCFHIANTLDRIDPALAKHYPTRDAYLDVLFKDRFALRCNALGIPTPLTFEPKSLDDALAAADTLGYPVLLKPRSHVLMRHFRGQVVESPEQMRKHFAPYQPPPVEAAVLRDYPDMVWPLVQEFIPRVKQQMSGSGALAQDGQSLAANATVKVDQSPSFMGTGIAFADANHTGFARTAADGARKLLGRGLYELEALSRPGSDEQLVIDVNPRVFLQMEFDLARGSDLPALWYQDVCGQPTPAAPPKRCPVWIDPAPLLVTYATRIVTGPHRWFFLKRLTKLLRNTRAVSAFDWRDLIASIGCFVWTIRYPQTFIRPHIREARTAHAPIETPNQTVGGTAHRSSARSDQ
ncbi:MAG: hypothetical protein VX549_03880 [Pseudomonadota bacterium]|nr:hypothetical protein [Pseudomonadota bacterium]